MVIQFELISIIFWQFLQLSSHFERLEIFLFELLVASTNETDLNLESLFTNKCYADPKVEGRQSPSFYLPI